MSFQLALLKDGPFVLLNQLASLYSKEVRPDPRAQVIIYCKSGKIWIGTLVSFVKDLNRSYMVLETLQKNSTVVIDSFEIEAIEFENLESVHSLLEKPWLRDPKFQSMSRLQFKRELDTFWKGYPNQKLIVAIDSFPVKDETPGALFSWLTTLKSQVDLITNEKMGKEALLAIDQITVLYGEDSIVCQKEGKELKFSISLSKESFDSSAIAKLLNDNL